MKQPFTDIDLLVQLQKDDARAFDQVFEHFYSGLLYFAVAIVSNKQEGEDIVMDTFRKFWQLRHNFETVANIKAFLYITTRNACFNYLKYAQRQTVNRKKFTDETTDEIDGAVELKMIEAETLQIIYNAVKQLPKKCRKVFELTYFEGLNNHEISKELGISISTITSQRSRAIHLLKESLSGVEWVVVYGLLMEQFMVCGL
jgi:RNA polymerase sigma-70 factor (family 1)